MAKRGSRRFSAASTTSRITSGDDRSIALRNAARTKTLSGSDAAATNTIPSRPTLAAVVRSSKAGRNSDASSARPAKGGATQAVLTRNESSRSRRISCGSIAGAPSANALSTKRCRRSSEALYISATSAPVPITTAKPRVAEVNSGSGSNSSRGTSVATNAAVPTANSACRPSTRASSGEAGAITAFPGQTRARLRSGDWAREDLGVARC